MSRLIFKALLGFSQVSALRQRKLVATTIFQLLPGTFLEKASGFGGQSETWISFRVVVCRGVPMHGDAWAWAAKSQQCTGFIAFDR